MAQSSNSCHQVETALALAVWVHAGSIARNPTVQTTRLPHPLSTHQAPTAPQPGGLYANQGAPPPYNLARGVAAGPRAHNRCIRKVFFRSLTNPGQGVGPMHPFPQPLTRGWLVGNGRSE